MSAPVETFPRLHFNIRTNFSPNLQPSLSLRTVLMGCASSCTLDGCSDCFPLTMNPRKYMIKTSPQESHPAELQVGHFSTDEILGAGGFGYVKRAKKNFGDDCGTTFALKIMRKDSLLIRRRGVQCVMTELSILLQLDHPFICNVHYAFQDTKYLYLALDYCAGGDMRYNLGRALDRHFSEDVVRFYAAQLILAIEYCHSVHTLHRDVKPENILLTESGYIKLTDFGVSRRVCPSNMECDSSSGTHGYMAMEIYHPDHRHGPPADWFALGVTLHEFATSRRPFDAKLLKACSSGVSNTIQQFSLSFLQSCHFLTFQCQNFISKLLHVQGTYRMTPTHMRNHPWMAEMDWKELEKRTLTPPMGVKPDTSYVRSTLTSADLEKISKAENSISILSSDKQLNFIDYRYRCELNDSCKITGAGETQVIGDSACGSSWSENTSWRGNAKVPHYSKDSYEEIKIGSPRTKRIVLTPEEPSLFNSTGGDAEKENININYISSAREENVKTPLTRMKRLGAVEEGARFHADRVIDLFSPRPVPRLGTLNDKLRKLPPLEIEKPASDGAYCVIERSYELSPSNSSPVDSARVFSHIRPQYFRIEEAISSSSIVSAEMKHFDECPTE